MENTDDVIYQGEFYKLNESRKRLLGTKSDSWKLKYLLFYCKAQKPILEYHKKKPKNGKRSERTLTESFELWPSYKVEKLQNARGRTFVCEITSANFHIFLSADDEKQIDILVFLLQVQIRLKDNIKKEVISVLPDDSESQQKIGAKNVKCILHASPWGLTLVLEKTRSLLAQWPLKSIRYYETSGGGNFSIEAGRVAPMGEGLFSFKTQPGEDDYMYDLVDSYIVNTLDRVKPTQKGTPEEIEDYIREHDCLHSLTAISVCLPGTLEVRNVLKTNWNIKLPALDETNSASSLQGQPASQRQRALSTQVSHTSSTSTNRSTQSSSLVINLERPGDSQESRRSNSENHSGSNPDGSRVTVRPPPLPSRSTNSGGVPRRSQRRDHSIPRKVDVIGGKEVGARLALSESISTGSSSPTKPHPSPININQKVNNNNNNTGTVETSSLHEPSTTTQHTEFYNLSSPNMKVRVSKSPIVPRNPNKVGRAEYLLSKQHSGVKSPLSDEESWDFKSATVGVEDSREAAAYVDAVSRTSQKKYGGYNSVDRLLSKPRRDLSTSDQSMTSDYSCMESPVSVTPLRGYVNLQNSPSREVHHSRQRSAPDYSRENSRNSEQSDSSPVIRHHKKRLANESMVSDVYAENLDPASMSDNRPISAGNTSRKSVESSNQDSAYSSQDPSRGSYVLDSDVLREKYSDRKLSVFSGLENVDEPVSEWLMSASCEDLSDHMRTVIYEDNNNNDGGDPAQATDNLQEMDSSVAERSYKIASTSGSVSSSDKPPLPFTGLIKFHDHTETANQNRDRSKSFGYMNIPGTVEVAQNKPQSSAPSAHLIRKMVNARAKQEALRKSLSNPNFLNLGSKEHLFNLKTPSGSTAKLASQHKNKSKSFGSLFPAIKKALSRESLGHSRSTTPERRNSRSTTPERRLSLSNRRDSNDADPNFRRQSSFHSVGEMSIKGIRMTERSRSFRRVRGTKSMEVLSKKDDEGDMMSRLSSGTTVSSPTAADLNTQNSTDDSNRISAVSSITDPPSAGSSMTDPSPADAAPSANLSSVHSVQTTPTSSNLPSIQNQSPPPIPPKNYKDESLLTKQLKKSVSVENGFSVSLPYQNTSGNERDKMSTQDQMKPKRHVVSDIIAKTESNSADLKLPPHRQPRSQYTESVSDSIDSKSYRKASTDQDSQEQNSMATSSSLQRKHIKGVQMKSSSTANDSEHSKSERNGQVSESKKLGFIKDNRNLESDQNKIHLTNGDDRYTPRQQSVDSKLKTVHTMPSPFQPIPFKKQLNGVRSVQAPRPSKP